MSLNHLREKSVNTTPENAKEANDALYRSKWNLPQAAKHCGMTQKEMKLTFWEYLKYHKPDYEIPKEPKIQLNFDGCYNYDRLKKEGLIDDRT